MIRECLEEVGVQIDASSIALLHTMHRVTPERYVIDLFFSADFAGEPINAEPDKASELRWVSKTDPSIQWMDYIPRAWACIEQGESYSEYGFKPQRLTHPRANHQIGTLTLNSNRPAHGFVR